MKIKFVGESDHIVCLVGKSFTYFEHGEFIEVSDAEAAQIMAKHVGKFEKEEVKSKPARVKVMPEVIVDESSK